MTLAANLAALARRVIGLSANNLVALDAGGKLPAVDGSLLIGLARGIKNVQVFDASGTYTPTVGVTKALVIVTGGGAGLRVSGGGAYNRSGAGAGGTAITLIDAPTPTAVTVGAGGAAMAAGGASSFGSTVIGGGGSIGVVENASVSGAFGGVASGGVLNIRGGNGGDATGGTSSVQVTGSPGASFWGGPGSPGAGAGGGVNTGGTNGRVVVLEY